MLLYLKRSSSISQRPTKWIRFQVCRCFWWNGMTFISCIFIFCCAEEKKNTIITAKADHTPEIAAFLTDRTHSRLSFTRLHWHILNGFCCYSIKRLSHLNALAWLSHLKIIAKPILSSEMTSKEEWSQKMTIVEQLKLFWNWLAKKMLKNNSYTIFETGVDSQKIHLLLPLPFLLLI